MDTIALPGGGRGGQVKGRVDSYAEMTTITGGRLSLLNPPSPAPPPPKNKKPSENLRYPREKNSEDATLVCQLSAAPLPVRVPGTAVIDPFPSSPTPPPQTRRVISRRSTDAKHN